MTTQNLATMIGLDLRTAREMLTNRTASSPRGYEVGEYAGRFYLLNYVTDSIERLTYGAFLHLSRRWKAESHASA